MKSKSRVIWGVFFILVAAFAILDAMGCFGEIGVWTILFSGLLIKWFVTGIVNLSWGNMLFPLAFAAILFDDALGIEALTPWPVLIAALCGTIGLNMIFGKKPKVMKIITNEHNFDGKVVEETQEDDMQFNCEVAFGSCVKYINCQNLQKANVETSFGNTTIYFDNARLYNCEAVLNVECSFGKTTLYIPKEWKVVTNISKAFGNATEKGTCDVESLNKLYINGEVSFGNIEIIYI